MSDVPSHKLSEENRVFKDAHEMVSKLDSLVKQMKLLSAVDGPSNETEFNERVDPIIELAATHSKNICALLKEIEMYKDKSEVKKLQKLYAITMKDFQVAHNDVAAKRETICDQGKPNFFPTVIKNFSPTTKYQYFSCRS